MTVLVIEYDGPEITGWRYETDEDYLTDDGELVASEDIDHRDLEAMMVDVDADPHELVENPDYDPRTDFEKHVDGTPVRRADVSETTRSELKDAIDGVDDPDTKDALATIYEVLTGNDPWA